MAGLVPQVSRLISGSSRGGHVSAHRKPTCSLCGMDRQESVLTQMKEGDPRRFTQMLRCGLQCFSGLLLDWTHIIDQQRTRLSQRTLTHQPGSICVHPHALSYICV